MSTTGGAHRPWLAACAIIVIAVAGVTRAGVPLTPDGVAYLDLSDAALAGRWHEFVNAYWSPLFPLLLAAARLGVGSSADREPLAVMLVNGVAVVAVLASFASVLHSLTRRGALPTDGVTARIAAALGWSVVAGVVLRITPIGLATPDLLVVAAQLTAVAAVLQCDRPDRNGRAALTAGAALGVGYLAKGAVLMMAASYLVVILFLIPRARRRRVAALMFAGLGLVALPWVIILSIHEGGVTIGSVGRLNLAWYTGGQSSQVPDPAAVGTETLVRQWPRLTDHPVVYDYTLHEIGTYPPWTDPTWWHEGLVPNPTLPHLGRVVRESGATIWSLFGVSVLAWCLWAALQGGRPVIPDARASAALAFLGSAQVAVYWPVHIEVRFLGVAWIYAWLAVLTVAYQRQVPRFRTVLFIMVVPVIVAVYAAAPPAFGTPRELAFAAVLTVGILLAVARSESRALASAAVLALAVCAPWMASTASSFRNGVPPESRRAADIAATMRRLGIPDSADVASVNASTPAAWARLGRWRIVAEVARSESSEFWRMNESGRSRVIRALAGRHVRAVVGIPDAGASAPADWTPVPGWNAAILPLPVVAK